MELSGDFNGKTKGCGCNIVQIAEDRLDIVFCKTHSETEATLFQNRSLKEEYDAAVSDLGHARLKLQESERLNHEQAETLEWIYKNHSSPFGCHNQGPRCPVCMAIEKVLKMGEEHQQIAKRVRICGFWEAGVLCENDEPCQRHGIMPTNRI